MTEPVWLEHPDLPGQKITVERQSLRFYLPARWVETDPVPEPTAADLEAEASGPSTEPVTADIEIPEPEVTIEQVEDVSVDGDEPTE